MTTMAHSDGGLIIRAPDLGDAGAGEDYLALRYFAPFFNVRRIVVFGNKGRARVKLVGNAMPLSYAQPRP